MAVDTECAYASERKRPDTPEILWLPEPSKIRLSRRAQALGNSEARTPEVEEIGKEGVLLWRKQAVHTERADAKSTQEGSGCGGNCFPLQQKERLKQNKTKKPKPCTRSLQ